MAILGIDEVGRGPLAGPLVVGAVILPDQPPAWVEELKDSKALTAKKREHLNALILKEAPATGLGWVFPDQLDQIGITAALKLATKAAVKEVQAKNIPFSQIIIDGNINFLAQTPLENHTSTLKKADNLIKEVSAASIIAKVARDDYMKNLAKKYPNYGFESHVGYGTKKHLEAIKAHGICPAHRQSFEPIKSITGFQKPTKPTIKNTTKIGQKAEEAVANHLKTLGHQIIKRNHKTQLYEIDIISKEADKIYFTEVKYRKTTEHGSGLHHVTKQKQAKMHFAAESYLKSHQNQNQTLQNLSPLLAVAEVTGSDFTLTTWLPLIS